MPRPRPPHPNDVDLRRIVRALRQRQRYRYVEPQITGVDGGYEIKSPCCSRRVDPEGGIIDIARIEFHAAEQCWWLLRRDHATNSWVFHAECASLAECLELLNADPVREIWR